MRPSKALVKDLEDLCEKYGVVLGYFAYCGTDDGQPLGRVARMMQVHCVRTPNRTVLPDAAAEGLLAKIGSLFGVTLEQYGVMLYGVGAEGEPKLRQARPRGGK